MSNPFVGYSFTLSKNLDPPPPLLVSEVPSPCRTIRLLLHEHFPILLPSPPREGSTSHSGVYWEAPPERGDFLEPAAQ